MTDDAPVAIPWYKSTVLRGILTIIVTQIVGKLQTQYHFDTTVAGLGVNDIVSWVMDGISAGALAYMTHGRVTQRAAPAIVGTKSTADQINATIPSPPIIGEPDNAKAVIAPPVAGAG